MKKEIDGIIVPDASVILRAMSGKAIANRIIEISKETQSAGAPKRAKGREHIEKK